MRRAHLLFLSLALLSACAPAKVQMKVDPAPPPPPRFERNLRWKDWRVVVRALPGDPGRMTWYEVRSSRVVEGIDQPLQRTTYDTDGILEEAHLGDLKGRGRPVLVLVFSDGGRMRYGSIRLLECTDKGFRVVERPNTPRAQLEGYRGGDVWSWEGKGLSRRFPIYRDGDEPGFPRGGQRTLLYQWKGGKWRVQYRNEPERGPNEKPE